MTGVSLVFWTWLSIGLLIGVNSDSMGFLGTLYEKRGEATYDGAAPKDIFAKSLTEITVIIGRDSYIIRNFGAMKRVTMKKINKMALIDRVGNTMYNRGSQTLFMTYKTRQEYPIFTAANYKTYQMALDTIRSRVYVISRPDKKPYGKVFSFDTAYPIIDSNNRVVMEELTEFGASVSAIAVESTTGSIAYSEALENKWLLRLLYPLNTVNETLRAEQDERRGRKNNLFITTPKPKTPLQSENEPDLNNNIYDATTTTRSTIISTTQKETISNNDVIDTKMTTTSRPTTTTPPLITTSETTIRTPAVISQPRPALDAALNGFTDRLVSLYSQVSDKHVKRLIVENQRLRHQLTMLADKHEYLLYSANVFLTPVSLYSDPGEPNGDKYMKLFTLSARKIEMELTNLIDQICPA